MTEIESYAAEIGREASLLLDYLSERGVAARVCVGALAMALGRSMGETHFPSDRFERLFAHTAELADAVRERRGTQK